ncbi:MAG: hypothetical protein SPM04_08260 [Lachnospira sp.]|nr:hypothetical protein [Lachnospira sp.]
MKVTLRKTGIEDDEKLWRMQVEAFQSMYEKYQDTETSPAAEGIAQRAIELAEEIHGSSDWELVTILQEEGNCHLYEKMGYHQTGETVVVNERMTLVVYIK